MRANLFFYFIVPVAHGAKWEVFPDRDASALATALGPNPSRGTRVNLGGRRFFVGFVTKHVYFDGSSFDPSGIDTLVYLEEI